MKLYINSKDVEKTLEIVDQKPVEEDKCPNCDSNNLKFKRISGWLLLGGFLIFGVPILFLKGTWKCNDCEYRWVLNENKIRANYEFRKRT